MTALFLNLLMVSFKYKTVLHHVTFIDSFKGPISFIDSSMWSGHWNPPQAGDFVIIGTAFDGDHRTKAPINIVGQ